MKKKKKNRDELTVSIVVVCHNYGRYLKDCLESILAQTRRPDEILVIDDASKDKTAKVTRRFKSQGIRYRRVRNRNVHKSRRDGMLRTTGDILCFIDTDDKIPKRYVRRALKKFKDHRVALVYSDCRCFGKKTTLKPYPDEFRIEDLQRDNFLHAGSMVRREALVQARVFDKEIQPKVTQGDWFLWRHTLGRTWTACKQESKYRYRIHGKNNHLARRRSPSHYFEYAGLKHETVTLFIPLAGRWYFWERMRTFLENQTWPHDQVRLILLDTSQDPWFKRAIREWAAQCDYDDVRCESVSFGRQGLADEERHNRTDVQADVRLTMSRIYNRLAQIVDTSYCWIVEDDIVPPVDACEQLLRGFDRVTDSVSGAYRSRYRNGFVARRMSGKNVTKLRNGIEHVRGNGFGCVIIRRECFERATFTATHDFDHHFYDANNFIAKVNWSVQCRHG